MATKFISPFVSDATEGEVADEGDITIPDALLFNDSLDEGVDPTALLDDGVLPTECAAAEPKPGNVSQKELNDSLNAEDLDETQLPVNDDDLTQATVEKEVATSMKPTAVEPQSDRNKEQRKLAPKVNSSLSIEKKANANLEEKKLASTTEPQASKAMAKVRPSFGKKKKGFTPPKTVTKAAPNVTDQSKSNTQPVKTSDQNSSNKSTPQSSPKKVVNSAKLQPANNTGSELKTTSENMPSTEEKKAKGPDKMRAEEKKREKEKKEQERALKKQALEQKKMEREKKKAELEHQRNEKRLELEQKKAEREQKKMEKELKKMEKEQKKAEKQQTKASQKKQQIKDKKTEDTSTIEESIKKDDNKTNSEKSTCMEEKGRDTVNEGTDETNIAVKSAELETDKVEKENIPPIGEKQSSVASTKDAVAPLSPVASCDDKTKKQKEKLSPQMKDDDQQKSEVGVKEKENIPAKEAGNSDVSDHEELAKTTPAVANSASSKSTELNRDRTTKQKEKKLKKFSPPKAKESSKEVKKQRKPVIKLSRVEKSSGAGGDGNKKTQAGKEMKRKCSVYSDSEDELEPKRAKPIDHLGSVWVQCENANCKKWRLLRECDDPAKVPGKWVCSMNTDPDHNSCSAEEERWSDLGDSQEFVESPFIPGSLVWSKMDGYPWWPAMIEEDPNKETYYELGYRDSPIPVRYHVVFFDTPVSRGWVSSLHTLPYTGQNDPNKNGNVNVPQRLKRTLTEGKKQANKALGLSIKERLESLGFAKRFRGSRRKRQAEDSPEAVPTQSKFRKTTSSGERKSARLKANVVEEAMPVVSLKPLQNQHADSEEVISSDTKELESSDNNLMQQHEE